MKSIKYCWSIFAFVALLFTSCNTEEVGSPGDVVDENSAVLEFGAVLNDLAGRAMQKGHFATIPTCSDEEPAVAVITFSVDDGASKTVTVDVLKDDNGYFTAYNEDLRLAIASNGSVSVELQGFIVYDGATGVLNSPNGNLIWVAPSDAGNAGLFNGYVENALPFDFTVFPGTKPYINVEVLCFDRRIVNEYGYPFFDLMPSKIYPLCFFANLCVEDRHFVGDYSVDLYYNDGTGRIQLYSSGDANAMPDTGFANGEYFAKPLCLVVPDKPEGFQDSQDYLFYVITPKDWAGSYGDVDNTPLAEVGLSWDDVNELLNDDEETNEYIHVFIGCGDNTGGGDDCASNGGDADNDGICDDIDDCINGEGDGCDNAGGDDCTQDSDGDGVKNCVDGCPTEAGPSSNNGCPVDNPPSGCGTAFMFGDTRINTISNSNRWGWAENFNTADGTTQTFDFWRGAGQNDTSKGVKAGTVTITATGDQVQFTINLTSGFSISDLHVYLSEENPGKIAKSPGKYNRNDEVGDSATSFTLTRTSSDDRFWVIVHAGNTCN